MATHAVIAIPQSGLIISTPESLLDFRGRFHRWDGYPQMLGRTLFKAYRKYFGRDLTRMVDYLLYQHVDWEQIAECNLFLPARGIETEEWVAIRKTAPKKTPPSCFCHDREGNLLCDLSDEQYWYTPLRAHKEGIDWVYILASLDEEDCMGVCVDVTSMIKSGQLSSQYSWGWGLISVVALRGKEPNWDKVKREKCQLSGLPAYGIYGTSSGGSVIVSNAQNVPWANRDGVPHPNPD